jgi:hypothetical protein
MIGFTPMGNRSAYHLEIRRIGGGLGSLPEGVAVHPRHSLRTRSRRLTAFAGVGKPWQDTHKIEIRPMERLISKICADKRV